jgi:hypothetical protein
MYDQQKTKKKKQALTVVRRALTFYFGEHYRRGDADARPLHRDCPGLTRDDAPAQPSAQGGATPPALRELGAPMREWNGWKIALEGDVSDREEGQLCMRQANRRVQGLLGKLKGRARAATP